MPHRAVARRLSRRPTINEVKELRPRTGIYESLRVAMLVHEVKSENLRTTMDNSWPMLRLAWRQCGLEFEFLGLEPGLDLQGAKVSIDGLQARLAIIPKGHQPNPLQRMAFGVRK